MMPKEITDTFIRVFSKLPQRLIWKWESDIPENLPENIMMSDWLPQQDLLGKIYSNNWYEFNLKIWQY